MSPIAGLTDRTPSFKELGRLRLGIPKAEAVKGPQEIEYFRPDFRPDAGDAAALFFTEYGAKPTKINVRIPFAQIERCWDAFYMVYNKTGLLGMSDGQRWLYLRHNQSGALIVAQGGVVQSPTPEMPRDENGLPYMPFDKRVPVYSYTSHKGQDVAVFAKPEGRLKVLIPELQRAGYVTVVTHSVYNIIKISEQLAAIAEMGKNIGVALPLIPMVLTRRKEQISVSIDGKKSMQEKYLLNLEIDPAWMAAQWKLLDTLLPGKALPAPAPVNMPMLPAGELPTLEETEEGEAPFVEEAAEAAEALKSSQPETQPEPQTQPAQTNGTRPYAPAVLKEKLAARANANYMGKVATRAQIGLVAALMEQPFAGDDDSAAKRHLVLQHVFGIESTNAIPGAMVLAMLNDWLKAEKDSGGAYIIDPMALREIRLAHDEALKAQGQILMDL